MESAEEGERRDEEEADKESEAEGTKKDVDDEWRAVWRACCCTMREDDALSERQKALAMVEVGGGKIEVQQMDDGMVKRERRGHECVRRGVMLCCAAALQRWSKCEGSAAMAWC